MSDQEMEIEAIAVEVSEFPIELYKVLKIANAVQGGGEAKFAISQGYVSVNGEIELRKRCKIHEEDLIHFNDEYYVVLLGEPQSELEPFIDEVIMEETMSEVTEPPFPEEKKAKKSKKKAEPENRRTGKADKTTGRKLLSF